MPTTFLLTSFYWDNFYMFGMGPKKDDDGTYSLTFPMGDAKMPGIAADDIGKVAYGIFKKGTEYIGKTVGIAGEHLTGADMAAELLEADWASTVKYNAVIADVIAASASPARTNSATCSSMYHDFERAVLRAASRRQGAQSSRAARSRTSASG